MEATPVVAEKSNLLDHWLALLHCPGIGASRFNALIERYDNPETLFNYGIKELSTSGLPTETIEWLRNPDWSVIKNDIAWLEASDQHHIITITDSTYPELLKEIDNPPPLLFVHGNPAVLKSPQLGMVGSRNPSAGGKENAHNFAKSLVQAGLTVTSGMAMGIDAAAHDGALAAGGPTIAVTGTGLDRVYPARHRKLAHQIVDYGALISEFPIGTPPLADHFPRRNRIISGLSLGVLVVEAAPRSGSLITARLAAEQGREVFAIPGSIHNPMARGCHALIRQGAKLIETVDDIIEELGPLASLSQANTHFEPSSGTELEPKVRLLLEMMGHDPIDIDTLINRSNLTVDEVSSILLVLELQGMVSSTPGGLYSQQAKIGHK